MSIAETITIVLAVLAAASTTVWAIKGDINELRLEIKMDRTILKADLKKT